MDINVFTEKFADLFDDVDPALITSATSFRELDGWSSLTALSVIAMIDEEYDITLKGDDIRNAVVVKDLFDIVEGRL